MMKVAGTDEAAWTPEGAVSQSWERSGAELFTAVCEEEIHTCSWTLTLKMCVSPGGNHVA